MASAASRGFQRVFVGNLPWTVGHKELRIYFQEFGRVVNSNVIFDKKTGSSKGFGFVSINKSAIENIEKKTQHILEGNILNIKPQH